jgi:hypothetical protein
MIKVALLVLFAVFGAFAKTPPITEFYPATLTLIGVRPPYSYGFDIGGGGYVGTSRTLLHLAAGSRVKIKPRGRFIYVIDEDGKIQKTTFSRQNLSAPPPPPR